ncbi:MAG TPA: hypothetical protein VKS78_02655 [Roseiarcus sp.]|nr:hypothetical protein [Roseiarcus sp.]
MAEKDGPLRGYIRPVFSKMEDFAPMIQSLPLDPEPTQSDIQQHVKSIKCNDGDAARLIAEILWRCSKRKENPNLFAVPFASDVPDYPAYLTTPLWRGIRTVVLRAASNECVGCNKPAAQVHHRDYRPRVLAGEDLTPLVAICAECHEKVEMAKRESWQAGERLLQKLAAEKDRLR